MLFNELFLSYKTLKASFAGAKLEIIFKPTNFFCVIFYSQHPRAFSTTRTAKILQSTTLFQIILHIFYIYFSYV